MFNDPPLLDPEPSLVRVPLPPVAVAGVAVVQVVERTHQHLRESAGGVGVEGS